MTNRIAKQWEQIMARVHVSWRPTPFDPWWNGEPCWTWTGGTSGDGRGGGYGRISIDGYSSAVHRVTYTLTNGYVPSKRQIDHQCGNRLCCNPAHLKDMTHKQNQKRRRK